MRVTRFGCAVPAVAALLLAVGFSFALAAAAAPPLGWTTACRVVDVYDGDTLTVEVTRRVNVRLLDCWAPEVRGVPEIEKARGLKSRDKLRAIALDKPAVLHVPGDDDLSDLFTFGRVLGRLYVDGADVSETMVKGGFATKEKR